MRSFCKKIYVKSLFVTMDPDLALVVEKINSAYIFLAAASATTNQCQCYTHSYTDLVGWVSFTYLSQKIYC